GCSTRRSAPRRDEHPGACCARPGGARDRRACVARRLPRAHARDVWQRHVRGGVRLVVRPQPGGAAHRQRGARRGRDAARRARDELLSDVPGPCRLRRARGDDAGRARARRLLDARAPQRGGRRPGGSGLGARLHQPDGGADPRRQARLGGPGAAADLGAAEATTANRPGRLPRRAVLPGVRAAPRGALRRAPHSPGRRLPHLALRGLAAALPPGRVGRRMGGRHALGVARLLRRGRLRGGRRRAAVAAAPLRARGRRRPRRRDGQSGRGARLPRGRLCADAPLDPVHRQAADRRRAAAAEGAARVAVLARRPRLLLMRRLVFATQKLDPSDPILGATVAKVRALAERLDELVVLCDTAVADAAPANVRVHEFRAATQAGRGARFAAALVRELAPRPLGFVAHMIPLYAVLAAPLLRPLGIPLVLWYTHWKAHGVVRLAERLSTAVASVDRRSFPLASEKVRGIGHGIELAEFPQAPPGPEGGPLRALVLGRYSPAKG